MVSHVHMRPSDTVAASTAVCGETRKAPTPCSGASLGSHRSRSCGTTSWAWWCTLPRSSKDCCRTCRSSRILRSSRTGRTPRGRGTVNDPRSEREGLSPRPSNSSGGVVPLFSKDLCSTAGPATGDVSSGYRYEKPEWVDAGMQSLLASTWGTIEMCGRNPRAFQRQASVKLNKRVAVLHLATTCQCRCVWRSLNGSVLPCTHHRDSARIAQKG